jgi:hypothetical protein
MVSQVLTVITVVVAINVLLLGLLALLIVLSDVRKDYRKRLKTKPLSPMRKTLRKIHLSKAIMTTSTETLIRKSGNDFDSLGHLNCPYCNPETGPQKAYCGKQLEGVISPGDLCVVCVDISKYACPKCGV